MKYIKKFEDNYIQRLPDTEPIVTPKPYTKVYSAICSFFFLLIHFNQIIKFQL